jgi:hypothetical protein
MIFVLAAASILTQAKGVMAATVAVPTQSIAGALVTKACEFPASDTFTCSLTASSGQVHLIGFTVTGDEGTGFGRGLIQVTGLAGAQVLWYWFALTGQVANNPASTNELNVNFPVPVTGATGSSVTVHVPVLGNASGTVVVAMAGVVY